MNKEEKAQVVEDIATRISESNAIYAADYRGISVAQAATLRARLRDADATFRVVKNTLTLRAADKAGVDAVKELVEGPTAFTFVRGDPALAAKALDVFARQENVLEIRGGLLDGTLLDADAFRGLARLPGREQLNAQMAGVVAAPLTGLVRGLGSLLAGLAVALGQVRDQKGAEAPEAPQAPTEEAAEEASAEQPPDDGSAEQPSEEPAAQAEEAAEPDETERDAPAETEKEDE
jgi:large subunit ribosomal protein L10